RDRSGEHRSVAIELIGAHATIPRLVGQQMEPIVGEVEEVERTPALHARGEPGPVSEKVGAAPEEKRERGDRPRRRERSESGSEQPVREPAIQQPPQGARTARPDRQDTSSQPEDEHPAGQIRELIESPRPGAGNEPSERDRPGEDDESDAYSPGHAAGLYLHLLRWGIVSPRWTVRASTGSPPRRATYRGRSG